MNTSYIAIATTHMSRLGLLRSFPMRFEAWGVLRSSDETGRLKFTIQQNQYSIYIHIITGLVDDWIFNVHHINIVLDQWMIGYSMNLMLVHHIIRQESKEVTDQINVNTGFRKPKRLFNWGTIQESLPRRREGEEA